MNATFSIRAVLGDWVDDKQGGFDLWWKVDCSYVVGDAHSSTSEVKKRAGDIWLRHSEGAPPSWSWTAYHPVTGDVFVAGHRLNSADDAKAKCVEAIHAHFHSSAARG